jgi:hypothetical protein
MRLWNVAAPASFGFLTLNQFPVATQLPLVRPGPALFDSAAGHVHW